MKKIFIILLSLIMIAVVCTGCSTGGNASSSAASKLSGETKPTAVSGTVKTGGSTSVEKVMNALIFQFQDINQDVTINYEMNGSGDGIKNTISGMYEIGHSSRELKSDGTESGLVATPYAIDGIAVVLHKENSISSLSPEQIYDIYTGKIKNWKEVGGMDELITVITREASSGTRGAFAEIIGLDKKDKPESHIVDYATTCDSTGAIQTTVSQNKSSIGYMSFSDVDTTKVTTVQYNGIAISTDTLKNGTYKLKREFYLITKEGSVLSPAAQAFKDFVLSDEGQKLVTDNKLLPVK